MLVLLAWWYLIFIKFVTSRLSATQLGVHFSVWRSRFIRITSGLWIFLFFVPGILLTRFLDESFRELFAYLNLGWLAFTLLLSLWLFTASWLAIKLFFENQVSKCPHCGRTTQHQIPAVELCEHCGLSLGEWLFIPETS